VYKSSFFFFSNILTFNRKKKLLLSFTRGLRDTISFIFFF